MLSLKIDSTFSSSEMNNIKFSKKEQVNVPTPINTRTDANELAEEIVSTTFPVRTTSSAWGWFDDEMDEAEEAKMRQNRTSCTNLTPDFTCNHENCTLYHLTSQNVMEQVQKTFPPLHPNIDMPYVESSICWVQNLPRKSHLSARIQVRSFRIRFLDAAKQQGVAEYLLDLQLNNDRQYHITRWKRSSSIDRFVQSKLNRVSFPKSLQAWKEVTTFCRWFNRLEITYLEKKCALIHQFTQKLLYECASIHEIADFLEN
jgi:hypothetical protein